MITDKTIIHTNTQTVENALNNQEFVNISVNNCSEYKNIYKN